MDFREKVKKAEKYIKTKKFKKLLNKFYYAKKRHMTSKEQYGIMSEEEYELLFNTVYYANFETLEEDMEGLEETIRYEEIILIKIMFPIEAPTSIVKTENFEKVMLENKLKEF